MTIAALILCEGPVGEAEIANVRMIRHVAHAARVGAGSDHALIAVLDRNLDKNGFEEAVLPALRS